MTFSFKKPSRRYSPVFDGLSGRLLLASHVVSFTLPFCWVFFDELRLPERPLQVTLRSETRTSLEHVHFWDIFDVAAVDRRRKFHTGDEQPRGTDRQSGIAEKRDMWDVMASSRSLLYPCGFNWVFLSSCGASAMSSPCAFSPGQASIHICIIHRWWERFGVQLSDKIYETLMRRSVNIAGILYQSKYEMAICRFTATSPDTQLIPFD